MKDGNIDLGAIERIIESVEGVILIDLKDVQSTWKDHIDYINAKMQELREVCGLSDAS